MPISFVYTIMRGNVRINWVIITLPMPRIIVYEREIGTFFGRAPVSFKNPQLTCEQRRHFIFIDGESID